MFFYITDQSCLLPRYLLLTSPPLVFLLVVGVKEVYSTAPALLPDHLKPTFLEESQGFVA